MKEHSEWRVFSLVYISIINSICDRGLHTRLRLVEESTGNFSQIWECKFSFLFCNVFFHIQGSIEAHWREGRVFHGHRWTDPSAQAWESYIMLFLNVTLVVKLRYGQNIRHSWMKLGETYSGPCPERSMVWSLVYATWFEKYRKELKLDKNYGIFVVPFYLRNRVIW